MTRDWRDRPAADLELREAAVYYEDHAPGLGEELIAEVERVCMLIGERPAALCCGVSRFALVYRVDDPSRPSPLRTRGGLLAIGTRETEAER